MFPSLYGTKITTEIETFNVKDPSDLQKNYSTRSAAYQYGDEQLLEETSKRNLEY